MRDLRNPLAPSIFNGKGRKRRQANRTAKIESNKAKIEANNNQSKTVKPSSTSSSFGLAKGSKKIIANANKSQKSHKSKLKAKEKGLEQGRNALKLCQEGKHGCLERMGKRAEKKGKRKGKKNSREAEKKLNNFATKSR